jgi:hypothetical protein
VATQRPAAQLAAAGDGEMLADVATGLVARLAPTAQGRARLEDQCPHLVGSAADHLRHLGVLEVPELGEHERGPLLLGQAPDVAEKGAQVVALLHLLRQGRDPICQVLGRHLTAGAPHVQAAVSRRRVEPCAQVPRRSAGVQLPVGGAEGVLDRVLRLLTRPEQVPGQRQQSTMVAIVERLEGVLVAVLDQPGQGAVLEPSDWAWRRPP